MGNGRRYDQEYKDMIVAENEVMTLKEVKAFK